MSEIKNQRRRKIFNVALICLTLGFVGVIGVIKDHRSDVVGSHPQVHTGFPVLISVLSGIADEWKQGVSSMNKKKQLNLDEFEKIDFSKPGDPDFGDDPQNEFFNKEGRFGSFPFRYPDQEGLDAITEENGVRIIFNVRRHTMENGTQIDNLYAIIPKIDRKQLSLYQETKVDFPLEVRKNNHSVVIDSGPLNLNTGGLVLTQDNSVYVFILIYWRVKHPGDSAWQLY